MSDKPTKTNGYIKLLYQLTTAPHRSLPEETVVELLGGKSRSTRNRQLTELVEGCKDFPPLLIKSTHERKNFYTFSTQGWQSFLDAQLEGRFLLECYKQVGHLIDSELTEMVFTKEDVTKKDVEKVKRKFHNLVKIKARKTKESRAALDSIVEALISEHQIEITYDGGTRVVNPFTLVQYRENLFLLGSRKKSGPDWEIRTFNLARITNVKILKTTFVYPTKAKWDPVRDFAKASGIVQGEEKLVQLRVTGNARKVFAEKEFFGASLINSDKTSDTYSCIYTSSHEFLGQIFVYADEVEIINDDNLRNEFCRKAEAALKKNKSKVA